MLPKLDKAHVRALAAAALIFVAWRASLFAFDYIALRLIPKVGTCRPQWEVFGPHHDFWNGFFRWDAAWYRNIAVNGYTFHENAPSSVNFYPLFPHLARWLAPVFGSLFVAGLVVSNLASIGAVYCVERLGTLLYSKERADRAVTFLLVFPTSFFLSAFYTEGLFFFCSAASMYAFFKGRYVTCGVFGALAMLTRSSGIVLFGALALDLGYRLYKKEIRFSPWMLGIFLIPAALGLFMLLLKVEVGDPLAFVKAIKFWGRERAWPWLSIVEAFRKLDPGLPNRFDDAQEVLDAVTAVGFLAISASMVKKRYPVAFSAYVFLGILMPLATKNLASMARYALVLFPAFYWMSEMTEGRPRRERFVVYSFAFFLALYSLRFMRCAWAG